MATAIVKDYVLWAKHIRGDPSLVHRVLQMQPGETIELIVDGIAGTWMKMADGPRGRATAGLKPLDGMKKVWGTYFRDHRGAKVVVDEASQEGTHRETPAIPIEPPLARTEEERRAAFRAFLEIAKMGWRSKGPYGPREELYER